jgi:N utilization substance protein A
MLRRLLEMEVPEINQGLVEIKAIAREAGKRAKVAVAALRDGVDPVGACVGMRGVRIQSIVRDLNDEKIDVIEWNPDSATFISKSLSPARVSGVYLDDDPNRGKTAMVVVPEDQLSLAIGRAGVNARLSAKLTGWRIDIKSLPEAAIESIALLESVPEYAVFADGEEEVLAQVESILTKKSEGRPVTPEEYQVLRGFVERIQREVEGQRDVIRQAEQQKLEDVRASYPVTAYDVPLSEVGLSTRVLNLLTEADYMNAGALLEQLGLDEDAILGLQGIGPKAITEIREVLTKYDYPELVIEPVLEEEEVTLEGEEAVDGEQPEVPEPAAGVELVEGVEVDKAVTEAEAEEGATVVEKVVAEPETIEETFEKVVEGFDGTFTAEDIGEEEVIDEAELEELKKKKKEKSRVVEFDPDLGEMVVKRRRKRDDGEEWDKETF